MIKIELTIDAAGNKLTTSMNTEPVGRVPEVERLIVEGLHKVISNYITTASLLAIDAPEEVEG